MDLKLINLKNYRNTRLLKDVMGPKAYGMKVKEPPYIRKDSLLGEMAGKREELAKRKKRAKGSHEPRVIELTVEEKCPEGVGPEPLENFLRRRASSMDREEKRELWDAVVEMLESREINIGQFIRANTADGIPWADLLPKIDR